MWRGEKGGGGCVEREGEREIGVCVVTLGKTPPRGVTNREQQGAAPTNTVVASCNRACLKNRKITLRVAAGEKITPYVRLEKITSIDHEATYIERCAAEIAVL